MAAGLHLSVHFTDSAHLGLLFPCLCVPTAKARSWEQAGLEFRGPGTQRSEQHPGQVPGAWEPVRKGQGRLEANPLGWSGGCCGTRSHCGEGCPGPRDHGTLPLH